MGRIVTETASALQISRFSTQLLEQSGAQRHVLPKNGRYINEYTYSKGAEQFPSPDAVNMGAATLVTGSRSSNTYSAVFGYFQGRGASDANAATMAILALDVAATAGVSPMSLLSTMSCNTKFETEFINYLNRFRSNNHQQGVYTDVSNKSSIRSRTIRA